MSATPNYSKYKVAIAGLALFSMFFGAGNLILPPFLGLHSGGQWLLVTLGFLLSAVVLPMLGIRAHSRLQGSMYDFAKLVSPVFSIGFCLIIYFISITLPSPRTAAVAYEMAIGSYTSISPLVSSLIYFAFVFFIALNRGRILNLIGKYLTPIIVALLAIIIISTITTTYSVDSSEVVRSQFVKGILEGYQTYDAIGSLVVGGVLIISLNLDGITSFDNKSTLINGAAIICGISLAIMYTGLIVAGYCNGIGDPDITRTELLTEISKSAIGDLGFAFLSVLIVLACFTTAVGIVVGTGDFIKGLLGNRDIVYKFTIMIASVVGVLVGQFDVHNIIVIAVPILFLIYPTTIALILLNNLPKRFLRPALFRIVIGVVIIFSLPDFILSIKEVPFLSYIRASLPLGQQHLAWLIPSMAGGLIVIIFSKKSNS